MRRTNAVLALIVMVLSGLINIPLTTIACLPFVALCYLGLGLRDLGTATGFTPLYYTGATLDEVALSVRRRIGLVSLRFFDRTESVCRWITS